MDSVMVNATEPEQREATQGGLSPVLLMTLGLLTAIAPFAMDMYLPAFPGMVRDLTTSTTGVQLTLTAFLVGAGAGQVFFGPFSDRFGRRLPLIVGSAACALSSLATALAPTLGVLVGARFVQGLSAAAGLVIGRAIVSDLAQGKAAARAFSMIMIVTGIAPVIAPLAGGLLVGSLTWRGLLFVVSGIAALALVAVMCVVPESLPPERRPRPDAAPGDATGSGLVSRAFLGNCLTFAFAFGGMMAYISASPFLYQVVMGLNAVQYALLFGLNALALAVLSAVSARLASRVAPAVLLAIGVRGLFTGAAAFVLLVAVSAPPGWLAVPVFVAVSSLGLVLGNATALALGAVPHSAGKGSAVLGALQFGIGAVVSPLVGLGGEHTAVPLAAVLAVVACAALCARLVAAKRSPA